jgi:hypothetical protein
LHIAAADGLACVVRELLRMGADVDAVDADGCTALMLACESGTQPLCKVMRLVRGGADTALRCREGETALMFAERRHASLQSVDLEQLVEPGVEDTTAFERSLHEARGAPFDEASFRSDLMRRVKSEIERDHTDLLQQLMLCIRVLGEGRGARY